LRHSRSTNALLLYLPDRRHPGRWRTLQHITASPGKIGDIARAALVLTHFKHGYIK
jgi:hypothetical protein